MTALAERSNSYPPPPLVMEPWCGEGLPAADPTGPSKYYRARYYDPKIGRFLSEDPKRWEVSTNFYPYVDNNPVNVVDPMGLQGVPAVPCPTCGNQSSNVQNAVQTFCQNTKKKACRAALQHFGPPGGLLPCIDLKCATQIPITCVPGGCGGCGGPCNNMSNPTTTIFVQPMGFQPICGKLTNTIAHEAAHMCGVGPDATGGAASQRNKRAAQTVAALCE